MIGQNKILDWIDTTPLDKFPNFVIFTGNRGAGKSLLASKVAEKLNCTFVRCGIKVDEIREVIDTAYTVKDMTLFYIKDADTMRNEAKNAMLKITEEPPKNAYFVMSVCDDSTLLPTIKSRAVVHKLEPYTKDQIKQYAAEVLKIPTSELLVHIAKTPYEAYLLNEYGKEFFDYVALVVDNISEVSPANAFKSGSKLAFKDEPDKYDLKLFLGAFMDECFVRIEQDPTKYAAGITVTSPYISKMSRLGANKQQLYDMWVLAIREVWQ